LSFEPSLHGDGVASKVPTLASRQLSRSKRFIEVVLKVCTVSTDICLLWQCKRLTASCCSDGGGERVRGSLARFLAMVEQRRILRRPHGRASPCLCVWRACVRARVCVCACVCMCVHVCCARFEFQPTDQSPHPWSHIVHPPPTSMWCVLPSFNACGATCAGSSQCRLRGPHPTEHSNSALARNRWALPALA
jgi:hypothetical protein